MQRGRYPDKWAKNKYNLRLPFSAPYSDALAEEQPMEEPVGRDAHIAPFPTDEQPKPDEQPKADEKTIVEDAPMFDEQSLADEQLAEDPVGCDAHIAPPIADEHPTEDPVGRDAHIAPPMTDEQPTPDEQPAPEEQPTNRVAVAAIPRGQAQQEAEFICGKNAVLAALRTEQSINRVLLAEGLNSAFAAEIIKRCKAQGVAYQYAPKAKLAAIAGPEHRGVICELAAFHYAEIEDMLADAEKRGEPPLLLLLDSVEDPHNLGAVIRTALCVGCHGVIIPKRRAAALNATVAKTSAGASAYMPVARVANLSQTARALKDAGLWLAAADMDGQTAWKTSLNGPLALVLGGEDKGVSPLLKASCDFCVSLPMSGSLGSLNVSAAAAALLYEIRRQRDIL